jgi:AraC-like DNA-binding protein
MRFDRPVSQLTFDARSLDLPYTMPDATSLALAREQCQKELDALGLSAGLPERVRALIPRPEGGFRGLEDVASVLHRSVRTLKRQLGSHGVRFSELRDRALCERAVDLLRLPDRSLADVSTQVGYSNVTNFERAFQRWTGKTPAEYRRDHSRPVGANGVHAAGTG